jgi:hypothetical protein
MTPKILAVLFLGALSWTTTTACEAYLAVSRDEHLAAEILGLMALLTPMINFPICASGIGWSSGSARERRILASCFVAVRVGLFAIYRSTMARPLEFHHLIFGTLLVFGQHLLVALLFAEAGWRFRKGLES